MLCVDARDVLHLRKSKANRGQQCHICSGQLYALAAKPLVGSGGGIIGPKEALAAKPLVGSGGGIIGPKEALAAKPLVGSGGGIIGPAKAAEVLTVRAAMAARRTRLSFIDVLLDAK